MGLLDWASSAGSFLSNNADTIGTYGNLGMGIFSGVNQYQANQASQDYMDAALASNKDYFNWWKENLAPLQEARSENELHAMGFRPNEAGEFVEKDDDGNYQFVGSLSDDVTGLYQGGLDLSGKQMDLKQELFPEVAAMTKDSLAFQQDIMPQQKELYRNQLGLLGAQQQAALGDIEQYEQNRGLEQQFYDSADVDVEGRADLAASDVAQAYKDRAGTLGRDAARMGLNPNSGAFREQLMDYNLDAARDTASAKTQARTQAEADQYNRLGTAMNVRQRLGPAQQNITQPRAPSMSGGLMPQGGAANAGAQLPSGTQMQAAQMAGQSAQGYGQGAGYFLGNAFSGLGNNQQQQQPDGYSNKRARQAGVQPVYQNYGLGW